MSDSCDPVDCSLPGFSVHGIFQARVLEWVAISFSRRSSRPRNWIWVSRIVGRRFTVWATREVLKSSLGYLQYLIQPVIPKSYANSCQPVANSSIAFWNFLELSIYFQSSIGWICREGSCEYEGPAVDGELALLFCLFYTHVIIPLLLFLRIGDPL